MREDLRGKLNRLRKAERLRTGRKSRAKKRSQFVKDPFKFTRTLLSDECSGSKESTQKEIQHLHSTHSDPERDVPLGNCPRVDEAPLPSVPFDTQEPSWKEVKEVVTRLELVRHLDQVG